MISLNQLIITSDDYVFSSLHSSNDAIVIFSPYDSTGDNPVYLRCTKPLEDQVKYIAEHQVTKAIVIAENIDFLKLCPSLEELWIFPADSAEEFDYSPLYSMPKLKYLRCVTEYGECKRISSIDYSKLSKLKYLYVTGSKGNLNYAVLSDIQTLVLDSIKSKTKNLNNQFTGKSLKELFVLQTNISSLDGLETAKCLKKLELYNNRALCDLSQLRFVKDTLTHLSINNCGRISDFSILSELRRLKSLRLYGSNTLPSLDFLHNMPELYEFILYMNVEDGDLCRCDNIPYVSIRNRKHYNRKDSQFRKR